MDDIKLQDVVIERFQWVATLDERVCELCSSLDGKVVDANDPEYLSYQAPLHPKCFIEGKTPIYTDKGWVNIKDIKKGMLVLTHEGRFRKVLGIFREQKYTGDVVKISWGRKHSGRISFSFTITPEHKLLVNGEWIEAKDIKKGDFLKILSHKCKKDDCDNEAPFYKDYCSRSCLSKCTTKKQWASIEHRKNMSIKTTEQLNKEYLNGTRNKKEITKKANKKMKDMVESGEWQKMLSDQFKNGNRKNWSAGLTKDTDDRVKKASERLVANNPSKNPEVRKKMTESFRKTMIEHPERHPNFIMNKKGFISSIEKKMKALLDNLCIEYAQQLPIRQYFVDFAIEKEKICIECDGHYWHTEKTKERDAKRQLEIESLGWTVIRFGEDEINKSIHTVESSLINILSNHNDLFTFMDIEVMEVDKYKLKKGRTLYNFEVGEDNSYIAKGIISKNCRCYWQSITSDSPNIPDVNWVEPDRGLISRFAPFLLLLPDKSKKKVDAILEIAPFAPEAPEMIFNPNDVLDIEAYIKEQQLRISEEQGLEYNGQ